MGTTISGKAQKKVIFRVPNNKKGERFLAIARELINSETYNLKVRGTAKTDPSTKTFHCYLMGKTSEGRLPISIEDKEDAVQILNILN